MFIMWSVCNTSSNRSNPMSKCDRDTRHGSMVPMKYKQGSNKALDMVGKLIRKGVMSEQSIAVIVSFEKPLLSDR